MKCIAEKTFDVWLMKENPESRDRNKYSLAIQSPAVEDNVSLDNQTSRPGGI